MCRQAGRGKGSSRGATIVPKATQAWPSSARWTVSYPAPPSWCHHPNRHLREVDSAYASRHAACPPTSVPAVLGSGGPDGSRWTDISPVARRATVPLQRPVRAPSRSRGPWLAQRTERSHLRDAPGREGGGSEAPRRGPESEG